MSPGRCARCAVHTGDRDARFCRSCGAVLSQPVVTSADRPAEADAGVTMRRQPLGPAARRLRRAAPAGVAAVVLIAVVAGIGGSPTSTTTAVDLHVDLHVDLPDPAEVVRPAGDRVMAGRPPEGGCAPPGCEAWSATAGFGPVLVHDGRVFHLDAGELVVWDATSGEELTRARSLVGAPVMQPWFTLVERPAGDLVVAAAAVGGGLEAWRADNLDLAWRLPAGGASDGVGHLLQASAASIVTVRPRLGGDDVGQGVEVVGHDPDSGAERWSAIGRPTDADGLIVVRPEDAAAVEQLLDPATGETVLTTPIGSYAGSSADRVAVDRGGVVEVLSWPGNGRVAEVVSQGDEQVRFVGGLVARGPSGWAATPEDWLGTVRLDAALTTEVVDPADGRRLASFDDRPATVVSAPGGSDVIIVEEHGAATTVTRVGPSFEQRWRSELPWESQRVLRVRTTAQGRVVVDTVGADGAVVYWRFDARTGLPVAEGGFGSTAPNPSGTVRFDDLSIRWEPDQTVVLGPAGLVRFAGDVEVLHPAEPLLVRDGDQLIAVDQARASAR